jgi:hypothetical protein
MEIQKMIQKISLLILPLCWSVGIIHAGSLPAFVNTVPVATTFTVTSSSDIAPPTSPTPGTLRWAVAQVNITSGPCIINFNIAGSGTQVISLQSSLPQINNTVTIDGTTQPGYTAGHPTIELLTSTTLFMTISFQSAPGSKVTGLLIQRIGGLVFNNSDGCEISNNVIVEGWNEDIYLNNCSNCVVKGNYLGTDAALNPYQVAAQYGIVFSGVCNSNKIGTGAAGEANVIAYHYYDAILFTLTKTMEDFNLISQNQIYNNDQNITTGHAINLNGVGNVNKPPPVINAITTLNPVTGTAKPNDKVELFASTGTNNANQYLQTVTANASGNWTANLSSSHLAYIIATGTDASNNTSGFSVAQLYPGACPQCSAFEISTNDRIPPCQQIALFPSVQNCANNPQILWNFGDGSAPSTSGIYTYATAGTYTVTMYIPGTPSCPQKSVTKVVTVASCIPPPPCVDCLPSFSPLPDYTYIISAWVKDPNAQQTVTTYINPQLSVIFPTQTFGPFTASGKIIDGWQRIEQEFTVPHGATTLDIKLGSLAGIVNFDDIRVFPKNGVMKSYVYDPITLRLVAELDERNYATIYEYDEEGKLIRVKKETERGIMTTKESKNSTVKKNQ